MHPFLPGFPSALCFPPSVDSAPVPAEECKPVVEQIGSDHCLTS